MRRRAIKAALRFRILERDGFACRYCGARPPKVQLHVDHVIPVSRGGTNDMDNLVAACTACNLGKGARELEDVITVTIADPDLLDLVDTIANEFEYDEVGAVELAITRTGEDAYSRIFEDAEFRRSRRSDEGTH